MFALSLLIVFTTGNHHLKIFLQNYFTSQHLEWSLYVMKTLILYLTEIVSKNSERNIQHCIYLFMFYVVHVKFEMNERKFVGESSILVSIPEKIRTWKFIKGWVTRGDVETWVMHLKTDFPRITVVIIQNWRPAICFLFFFSFSHQNVKPIFPSHRLRS